MEYKKNIDREGVLQELIEISLHYNNTGYYGVLKCMFCEKIKIIEAEDNMTEADLIQRSAEIFFHESNCIVLLAKKLLKE